MSFEEMAESAKSRKTCQPNSSSTKAPFAPFMKDGETWFVAKDVCDILGLDEPKHGGQSIRRR